MTAVSMKSVMVSNNKYILSTKTLHKSQLPTKREGQNRCVGSCVFKAWLVGKLLGHKSTEGKSPISDVSMSPMFTVPVCKSPAPGTHPSSIVMQLSIYFHHLCFLYRPFLSTSPPNPPPLCPLSMWSQREGESLAGNKCKECVISASVCRANQIRNQGTDNFPFCSLSALRGRWRNFGYFGLTLKEKRSNWLPLETD